MSNALPPTTKTIVDSDSSELDSIMGGDSAGQALDVLTDTLVYL